MPQLTIYLDEQTLRGVERAAKAGKLSVSRWVREQLTESLERSWPDDYFSLFGRLASDDLERPHELDFADDAPREEL